MIFKMFRYQKFTQSNKFKTKNSKLKGAFIGKFKYVFINKGFFCKEPGEINGGNNYKKFKILQ